MNEYKWIDVNDRLPKQNELVLVFHDGGLALAYILDNDYKGNPMWSYTGLGDDPSYWMALPKPPNQQLKTKFKRVVLDEKCEFCEKFDFTTAKVEVTKYGANILLALCNTKFPQDEQFNFCPVCGKNLKE